MRALDVISIHAAGSGHPGGTLSVMDLAAVLFLDEARYDPADPEWEGRDRIFFSAGHKAPAVYAALTQAGYCPEEEAVTLRKLGSRFQGHPHAPILSGLEVSSGSLGQGLGIAVGCALAGRMGGGDYRVYCVMGDGEQQEGSVWEAAMAAAHYGLDTLCAIVDRNGLQIDGPVKSVMNVDPLSQKYLAFGWNVLTANGHDIEEIQRAFRSARAAKGKPTLIVADTVKGKAPLRFGKANVIRYRGRRGAFRDAFDVSPSPEYENEREDVTIVACGPILCEVMRAAFILKEEHGIQTRVLNMHTVKPLDVEAVLRSRAETGAVLTCEEHQKGGFGNIVAGALCAGKGARDPFVFDMMGIEDRFGESGRPRELFIRFGLTAEDIAVKARELVQRKNG